jgi:hypothetical protein
MTNFRELVSYAKGIVAKHPALQEEIDGLLELCWSEIEEGSSVQHEINLCQRDIETLVAEKV